MNGFNNFVNNEEGCKESDEVKEVIEETGEETATTGTTKNDETTNDDGLWTSNVWERRRYNAPAEEPESIDY